MCRQTEFTVSLSLPFNFYVVFLSSVRGIKSVSASLNSTRTSVRDPGSIL